MPPFSNPPIPAAALRIIRLAMAAGAVLFGCFGLWRASQGLAQHSEATNLQLIGNISYGFSLAAAAGVYAVRSVRARMQPAVRSHWSVIGWALAEAAAMFGGVVQILGGGPWPWAVGMAVIALSWTQVPVEPEQE